MCLAIYKPATTTPDWSAYRNGFAVNDDSWGFAVVVDGTRRAYPNVFFVVGHGL